ncbi:hypothetical protein MGWOODY_Mmi1482 [hydrothermal vent metagenome]|uniref:Uncharacterized protein n=1 Tax=hydrothermal vent metagenome TaxID=652676 RepID=A0A160VLY3_9ZZZZ
MLIFGYDYNEKTIHPFMPVLFSVAWLQWCAIQRYNRI